MKLINVNGYLVPDKDLIECCKNCDHFVNIDFCYKHMDVIGDVIDIETETECENDFKFTPEGKGYRKIDLKKGL